MLARRNDLRNVAIIAHVDHGKTTLGDALLWQSGSFRENQDVADRVMDSMDLEREKGITILAKNTSVSLGDVRINIVDTPGHADFGGEVERALTMVDGVLLLVDASEGPLPQTRFVLRKALELKLPVVLVINKVDRHDARPAEVVNEVYELFLDLDADSSQIEFPIVYANARAGRAGLTADELAPDLGPTLHDPARHGSSAELRPRASAAGAGHESRRGPVRRPARAAADSPRDVAQGRADCLVPFRRDDPAGTCDRAVRHRGARPCSRRRGAAPARSSALAEDLPEVTIGETIADLDDPRPLPVTTVDEPSLSVTIGINTSPLAGTEGTRLTASQVKQRLDAELVGNVSLRVLPTARPDAWEVQGRGELQLAILVELMRR